MEAQAQVFAVNPQTFQTDVIERSQNTPVILLFWAEQVSPSTDARRQLEALAPQYSGKVWIALVDVAEDQTLAQHLRVQGLPSIRVIQGGQIVDQLDGPQDENTLRALLDTLTLSSGEVLRAPLEQILERGDFDAALELLQQVINEEPQNQAFRVELADVLIRQGKLEDARQALGGIPEDVEGRDRPVARLGFAEEVAGMRGMAELEAALGEDADDLEACYELCIHHTCEERFEQALEIALSILQADREFRDDIGRTTMIRIFQILPKGSEIAGSFRRRMFNFMH
ncbi:MAG: tetratricopeptide repeat protein [Pseudomonadales bacterium]|jgi:putative thioredoxin|nr:tetratricopeptide repeat protein [Pseudomonadales bacterium]MDP6471028.1 tetratricopeptide repeat protein [Pseudomonadales bacterium]MDP6825786.1 tetratricopeptide repeat protein [Pseudomonadales bacterium]MDP6970220.1 tetratricopeptide repeat protein [Pseudomonadales bacterium]|tara:strand:+ start:854 stop:1708 length:855 start_codon:yes stop_codon:yes gene_type:complete